MRRSRHTSNHFSFFSFQDIMIGTIGVVLIIILLLLLHVGDRTASIMADATPTEQVAVHPEERADDLPTIESLRQQLKEVEEQIKIDDALIESLASERARLADEAADRLRSGELTALHELDLQAASLQGELEELNRRKQISYLIADDDSDALIVELSAGRLITSRIDASEAPRLRNGSADQLAADILAEYASSSDRKRTHLLIAMKPSGIPIWKALQRRIKSDPSLSDVQLGVDLISETSSTTAMFPARPTR